MSHLLNLTLISIVAGTAGVLIGAVGALALHIELQDIKQNLADEKLSEDQIQEAMNLANNLSK